MKKRNIILIIVLILLFITLSLSKKTISSFLLASGIAEEEVKIGDVKVVARVFYQDNSTLYPAREVAIDEEEGIYKKGIYYINVSDPNSLEYIDNLCVKLYVYSDVNTYIRLRLFEQLTVKKIDTYESKEYALPISEPVDYYFNSDWVLYENYYYYPYQVKRQDIETPTEIDFIIPTQNSNFEVYDNSYYLQFAIRVEAVQAILGPQNNWGLENAPWGGEW